MSGSAGPGSSITATGLTETESTAVLGAGGSRGITTEEVVQRYDGVLLDAYGVLVDKTGALPGAKDFVRRLNEAGRPFLVLTNSASRLPATLSAELTAWGLPIPPPRILTSGDLLADWFSREGLAGAGCVVLGPADSEAYVGAAGGRVLDARDGADAQVVVIADQKGFPCLERMDQVLSLVLARLDAGRPLHLLVCNPDLVYPVAPGRFGFTAGSLAAMLEAVIRQRYPSLEEPLVRLGKPYPPLFEAARKRMGGGRLVMLGDQLATDILGANRCGIDSVLVGSGLARRDGGDGGVLPTWYLGSLSE
jgi:HAD superfamily hydrolase (TIGR01459 family)